MRHPRVLQLPLLLACCGCQPAGSRCDGTNADDTACPSPTNETDDTGDWAPLDPRVSEVELTYGDGSWTCTVTLVGWAGLVTLSMQQPAEDGGWQEIHTLTNQDYARDGTWDLWHKTLFVVSPEDQMDNVSTAFAAEESVATTLTWMLSAWDRPLTHIQDCVVWGRDPTLYADQVCRPWSER